MSSAFILVDPEDGAAFRALFRHRTADSSTSLTRASQYRGSGMYGFAADAQALSRRFRDIQASELLLIKLKLHASLRKVPVEVCVNGRLHISSSRDLPGSSDQVRTV